MKSKEFINNIDSEITSLVDLYEQGVSGQTEIGIELENLGLDDSQKKAVLLLIRQAIDESTYNLISGIEGSASLGNTQENYTLLDENGVELTGELDALFYEKVME